jgi:Ala-tRNA(Pro) deacylase
MSELPNAGRLEDGSAPATPDDLFALLEQLDIAVTTVRHRPVFTVEEARAHRGELPGVHTKSLFLRDKKGTMTLVVCLEDRAVDLKDLGRRIGAGRLSFASPERLMKYLGVVPGAVSPFALVNDTQGRVRVVFDRAVLAGDPVNLHPLDNALTTAIAAADLSRFLEAIDHPPQIVDLP